MTVVIYYRFLRSSLSCLRLDLANVVVHVDDYLFSNKIFLYCTGSQAKLNLMWDRKKLKRGNSPNDVSIF